MDSRDAVRAPNLPETLSLFARSRTLPDDAEAGGGLMVAIIQLAIASGAIVGGLVFGLSGYQATFELGAAVLGAAALLAWLAARAIGNHLWRSKYFAGLADNKG